MRYIIETIIRLPREPCRGLIFLTSLTLYFAHHFIRKLIFLGEIFWQFHTWCYISNIRRGQLLAVLKEGNSLGIITIVYVCLRCKPSMKLYKRKFFRLRKDDFWAIRWTIHLLILYKYWLLRVLWMVKTWSMTPERWCPGAFYLK